MSPIALYVRPVPVPSTPTDASPVLSPARSVATWVPGGESARSLQRERGARAAHGVLISLERREDGVADQPVDTAVVALDRRDRRFEERVQHPRDDRRLVVLGERREPFRSAKSTVTGCASRST